MSILRAIAIILVGFVIIVNIFGVAVEDTGSFIALSVFFGLMMLGIYTLANPLILNGNRRKLVAKSNKFIDSLGIAGAGELKKKLVDDAERWISTRSATQEFAGRVERTLIEAIALSKIQPHLAVLRRKKAQNVFVGDYGILQNQGWLKECNYFVRAVLLPLDLPLPYFITRITRQYEFLADSIEEESIEAWVQYLDSIVDAEDSRANLTDLNTMSGYDYEAFVGNIFEDCGWHVEATKGSGDQGADVIAERDGLRIVVQCKLYASTVGNKAVQEVFAARSFYDCDYACVVSNSTYTPSARKIAERTGVQLLHHDELPEWLDDL